MAAADRTATTVAAGEERATAGLLRVEAVTKSYESAGTTATVLDNLDLVLQRGETTSLMGTSGSGKSTLLALLAGLMRPDAGSITFDGLELTALDDTERARLRASRIGVVMQTGNLIAFLTAVENVSMAIELAGGERPDQRARELLCDVGLERRLDHLPRRLSGGESQRVSVAMALANEPELLLADEATGALDSKNAELVLGLIFDAWRERGLTVLFVTHSADLAGLAQHQLHLTGGQVVTR